MTKHGVNIKPTGKLAEKLETYVEKAKRENKGPGRVTRHNCLLHLLERGLEAEERGQER
jgi:hypothetical protein